MIDPEISREEGSSRKSTEGVQRSSSIFGRLKSLTQTKEDVNGIPVMSEEEKYQSDVLGALVGLLLASIIEFVQALTICLEEDNYESLKGFALALGSVSSLCSFAILTSRKRNDQAYVYNKFMQNNVLPWCSIFLTLWWGAGVVMCTFEEPFEKTGNGYFACWIALMLSLYFCQVTISKFGAIILKCKNDLGNPQQRALIIIAFFSCIEGYACIQQLDEYNTASGRKKASPQEYFGLYCGFISAGLIILTLIYVSIARKGNPGVISWVLLPLWLIGAGIVTFDEPFTETGNGYFCAWGAFCVSLYLFYLNQTASKRSIMRRLTNKSLINIVTKV